MTFLRFSTGSVAHCSWASCFSSLRFDWCLLPTASFSSFRRCPMGFRGGLDSRPLQKWSNVFISSIHGCFFEVRYYPGGPMTCTWDSFWHGAVPFTPKSLSIKRTFSVDCGLSTHVFGKLRLFRVSHLERGSSWVFYHGAHFLSDSRQT